MVGFYYDAIWQEHGFVYTNGTFTTLDEPGSPDTYLASVNDRGQILGQGSNGYFIASLSGPTVTSVAASPLSGDLNAGHTIILSIAFSEAVTVSGGTPFLTLNDGDVATYTGGSGTDTLTFSTTVAANDQSVAALAVTGVNLDQATVEDQSGFGADFSGAITSLGGLQIDTVTPSVTAVATSPTGGTDGVGDTIEIALTLSEAVIVVGGPPTLALNDGGVATYSAGSGSNTLTFTYIVGASDSTGKALAITGVSLGGGMISDAAGNQADLSAAVVAIGGPQIDTNVPAVTGVSAYSPGGTDLAAGQLITITVTTSKPVYVNGHPTLTLSDGATAVYAHGSGTSLLSFQVLTAAGQNTTDLQVTGLAGAAITDEAGNALSGSVAGDLAIQIDTTAPTVSTITATTDDGATALNAGHVVTITLTTSEPVIVDTAGGTPMLLLNDGRTAIYAGGSGPSALIFTYVVAPGDTQSDLQVTGLATNGGTIADEAANTLAGAVTADLRLLIDTTTPTILSVAAATDTAASDLDAGRVVIITVITSRPVEVDTAGGVPRLLLNGGLVATYGGGSGSTALTFSYTVQPGNNAGDLTVTELDLNGGTIRSSAGSALTGSAAVDLQLQVDTVAPMVANITASVDDGATDLDAGRVVTITLHASEPVIVDSAGAAPTLLLSDGEVATYGGGSGTSALTFTTTVKPGDQAGDLAVTALSANGATITDGAGNLLSGSVSAPLGLQVDTTIPTLSVTATTDSGAATLDAGHVVTITLDASKTLTVDTSGGTPSLSLNDGGSASYVGGSGTDMLTFRTLVAAGQNSADLQVTGLVTNGGTIQDAAGNSLPAITADLALTIDTAAPAIAAIAATADNGGTDLDAGHVITIAVTTTEPVYVNQSGGQPTLRLNDGALATYVGGSGTTTLTFVTTVQAGNNAADLGVTALQTGGATLLDAAGNALTGVSFGLGLQIDTTPPTVSAIIATTDNQATILGAGRVVTLKVTATEKLIVDDAAGVPALLLSDGGTATYQSGSGTASLVFKYTVTPGDTASDLQVTGLIGNGGAITDYAGNPLAAIAGTLGLAVDTTIPGVTAVAAVPATSALPGQTVTITLSLSDGVTVDGGTPTLTLNDGGTATYSASATAALGDPTKLVFTYPVSLSQTSTPALAVTGIALNGASIVNAAGTGANLAGAETVSLGVVVDTDLTWNAGYGDWSNPANWSAGVVPKASNKVILQGGAQAATIVADGNLAAFSMVVADTALVRQSGTLTLAAGMTVDGVLVTDVGPDGYPADGPAVIVAPGGITIDAGALLRSDGETTLAGDVVNNSQGVLAGSGGLLVTGYLGIAGNLTGIGTTAIAGGLLELHGSVSQAIAFTDGGDGLGTLRLDSPGSFEGTITGVTIGRGPESGAYDEPAADIIDLGGVVASAATYDGGTLTVFEAGGASLDLAVAGSVAGALEDATLTIGDDGKGGSDLYWQAGLTDQWIAPASGSWSDPANWSLGFPPGKFDTAAFDGAGATVATIAEGTSAQAYRLILAGAGQTLAVAGMLSLGTDPTLNGASLDVTGVLQFSGGATLDNATITLSDGNIAVNPLAQYDFGPALNSPGLTFGPGLKLVQGAGNLGSASIFAGSALFNDGTIDASVAGGQLAIRTLAQTQDDQPDTTELINAGLIHVGNGDQLSADGTSFDNTQSGALVVAAGALATLQFVNWSNEGEILVAAGSTLTIRGDFSSTSLENVSYVSGTLVLEGVPTDSGPITAQSGMLIIDPSAAPAIFGGPVMTNGQSFDNAVLMIETGATLELRGAPAILDQQFIDGQEFTDWGGLVTEGVVDFNGPEATLTLDDPHDFDGSLLGLAFGDAIDFAGTIVTQAAFGNGGLTITTADGGTATYEVEGTYWADEITLESDGAGGTILSLHPDVTPPAVTAVAVQTDNGATDLDAGHVVTITLTLREVVTVTGSPGLTLSDGATALYQSGSGSDSLVFTTIVAAGDNAPDLTIIGLDGSNGSIQDLGGNALASVPATDLALVVDTKPPSLVSVATVPSEGVFQPGQSVEIALKFSEAVQLAGGIPSLTLDNGGLAVFDAAATAALGDRTQLVFTYDVQPIDASSSAPKIVAYRDNGATVIDAAGNVADLSAVAQRPLGFGVNTAVAVARSGEIYFIAETVDGSAAVWKTDGTSAGTSTIVPEGDSYSDPSNLYMLDGTTYFTAFDANSGSNVTWQTDGTAAGTVPLAGGAPVPVATLGSTIISEAINYFSQYPGGSPSASYVTLYATDDSGTQTSLASWSISGGGAPSAFTVAGTILYFLAPDTSNTYQQVLWSSDGTEASEVAIPLGDDSFYEPDQYATFGDLTAAGSNLFFLFEGSLYVVAGGQSATSLGTSGFDLTALGSSVYFLSGGTLWVSDGTVGGTTTVASVNDATGLAGVGNQLFFIAADPITGSAALWVLDGSSGTPVELTNDTLSGISNLTAVGDKLFFTAYSETSGINVLWVTDGTLAGTIQVNAARNSFVDPTGLTADGSELFFQAYGATDGTQLWSSDGTTAGTGEITDIDSGSQTEGIASTPLVIGTEAYFVGFSGTTDSDMLWRTDGTAAGTSLVTPQQGGYSGVTGIAMLGSEIYFLASEPNGSALWQSDGTDAGTVKLSAAQSLAIVGSTGSAIFFSAGDGFGTLTVLSAGATSLATLPDGLQLARTFTTSGDLAYFRGVDPVTGQSGIYRSDGTAAGTSFLGSFDGNTFMVAAGSIYYADYYSGDVFQLVGGSAHMVFGGGYAYSLTAVGSRLFFATSGELWSVGGSGQTAQQLTPTTGSFADGLDQLTAVGNRLFFLGSSAGNMQLWESDGSSAGTRLLTATAGSLAAPMDLSTDGTSLYFLATDQSGDQVLWKSDGTPSGTVPLTSAGSDFIALAGGNPVSLNGQTLFNASQGASGYGLWTTSGTAGGATAVFQPVVPDGAYPYDIVAVAPATSTTTSGRAVDGYIANATVFADANGNGVWDPGEAETTSDASGNFSLTGGSGPLVLIGGTDTATHLAFTGRLEAPSGAGVVTPLTTVVEALLTADQGETETAAEQLVASAFGIDLASGQSLDSFDPIAGALAGASGGATAFAAQAEVLDTIDMAGAALGGIDTSLSSSAASADVLAALASDVAAQPGQPLDLTDLVQVGKVITDAAALDPALSSSPPSAGLVSQIADVVASSNSDVQQGVQNAATPQAALQYGSAVEQVAQGAATDALHDISQIDAAVANFTGASLTRSIDASSDDVTTPCYCAGTLILTDRGQVAVEELKIGDRVVTQSGAGRPIKWLGNRSYRRPFPHYHNDIIPVLFAAGSLGAEKSGEALPRRDLMVSPLHAMLIDGVLIPAGLLVNGVSIRRCPDIADVHYIHIELDSHDVVFAEGALSETFVDCDSRLMFHNAAEFHALYPGDVSPPWRFCAPRVEEGATLRRIRRALDEHAGCATSAAAASGRLDGFLDRFRDDTIEGWAWTPDQPDHLVELEILEGDGVIARITADRYRGDLLDAGIGDGRHGFALKLSPGLSPWTAHQLRVRRVGDKADLHGSPLMVAALSGTELLRDRGFGASLEAALRGARSTGELDTMIDVLAGEAARARRARSRWQLREAEAAPAAPACAPDASQQSIGVLAGMLELVTATTISGWACDLGQLGQRVVLDVFDGDILLGRVTAGDDRPDVRDAGYGDGHAGFSLNLPVSLAHWHEHVIHVRRHGDGAPLPGSPCVRRPVVEGGEPDQAYLHALLNSFGGDHEAGDSAHDVVTRLIGRLELVRGRFASPVPGAARTPSRRRVLIVDDRWPMVSRDAGSNAIIGHMRALAELGHAVEFVAAQELHLAPPASGISGLDVTFHATPAVSSIEDLLRRQGEIYDVVYLHRVSNALAYAGLARTWCKRARLVYGVADLHHLRLAREGIALGRPDLLARSRSVKAAELLCIRMVDAVLTHSPAEARYLAREGEVANVFVVPWPVAVAPLGAADAKSSGIAFIGGHDHRPNADAVAWLAGEIMPLVWAEEPDIICHVVGHGWPEGLFAECDGRICRTGPVALLSGVLAGVRLTVAPLRFGAGVKGKVLDSLAAGVPCVMSPIAAEGLPLCATLQGLVGQDAGEIAARIVTFYRDSPARVATGRAGMRMVKDSFDMASTTHALVHALGLTEAEMPARLVAG